MIPLQLAIYALLACCLAALLYRIPARRREKALALLSPQPGSRSLVPGLRHALRARRHTRAGGPRFALIAAAGLAVYLLTRSILLAFLVWPAALFARRLLDRHQRNRARIIKEEQVLDLIDSLSQSLRAGLSLHRSLEVSLEDIGGELGGDVLEVLKDVRVGGGLGESLTKAAEASTSPSQRLTFGVLGLMHGRGGDLPLILDRLRKRAAGGLEARREARLQTSHSRATGYLVSSLPAAFFLLQAALDPHSLRPLFTTPTGNLIVAVALAMNAVAFFIIRRMVDQEV